MTPAGKLQSVIELTENMQANQQKPADAVMQSYFRNRRYIGGSDRRSIGDWTYSVLRSLQGLQNALTKNTPRLLVFAHCILENEQTLQDIKELCNGYGPSPLTEDEMDVLENLKEYSTYAIPLWLEEFLKDKDLVKSLHEQANFDIRVNTLKNNRDAVLNVLSLEGFETSPTPFSPNGIRFGRRKPLNTHPFWQDGSLEVQDEASQIAGLLCDAKPGMQVLDYCAGAGGKSLNLAATMKNKGNLTLSDIHPYRLQRAKERLRRAGVSCYQLKDINKDNSWFKRQHDRFDRVLVDAPCTGTGTWRRNPDLKNRLTPTDLEELTKLQQAILSQTQKFVKVGGRLIYVTCSVLEAENNKQVDWFLKEFSTFRLLPITEIWREIFKIECPFNTLTAQFLPHIHHTDGFFISIFEKSNKEN
ncbi:MAG: RsmB/NOP family class I SAM-dependent RNA methyltransferase [Pseudomonadota bacterium]|jgi:16S rRNA (cytosine967-C5)-methyltransferase|nr:RsmB/NOP family class I SAM-dependent RNA methyltransferase [Alphaproteobacteria bacterium]